MNRSWRACARALIFCANAKECEALVALAFLATLLSYPLITFLPVMATNVFHGGSGTFTLFLCLSGMGSISGALWWPAAKNSWGRLSGRWWP